MPRNHLLVISMLVLMALIVGCERESPRPAAPGDAQVVPISAVAAVQPAAKPTGPLPEGTSCVTAECHAELKTSAFIHRPVASGECETCHQADTGNHTFPLKRGATETCTYCHAVAGTASHQHGALQEGCTACHEPHTSRTKFLLKAESVQWLCESCHNVPLKSFSHEPFTRGECTLCHQPHQAENKSLLRGGDGARHCFSCHVDLRSAMASAVDVHKPARDQCTSCHSPHSTDYPHVLKQPIEQTCLSCHHKTQKQIQQATVSHSAVTQDKSCINCHSGHVSSQPDLLHQRMDELCLTCHDRELRTRDGRTIANMSPTLRESQFLHGPIRAGDCSACHNSHGSSEHALLTGAFPSTFYTRFELAKYQLCFNCHQPDLVTAERTEHLTDFRDGDRNLHYLHVNRDPKGRACKTCHSVHGSNQPAHMANEVPFEGSNWTMQITYTKLPDGGSCSPGCHAPKTYTRTASADPTSRGEP